MDGQGDSWSLFRMRPLLLGLLVVTAQAGPTPVTGDASGSDWVNACIDLDWHSKEVALSETPLETAAGGTSQACGAGRITLGVPTDFHHNDRGCPGGPQKTGFAFRGGDCGGGGADKMMSVAAVCGRHVPNASASLDDDPCAESFNKDKCFMNVCTVCTRVIRDSEHAHAACSTCTDNKWSDFSLEGGSAHAWDEGVALLYPLEETLRAPGTCRASGETLGATGHSRPTTESTQGEKLLRTGARDFVRAIVDKITTLMTVNQRVPLRSEHKGCAFGADRSEENTATVLPLVHKCNVAAAKMSDEMKFGLYFPKHYPSDSTLGAELFPSVGFP